MRSEHRITWKKMGSTGFLLFILYAIWIQPASAQSPNDQKREIEQLKDKLEQLDQMMKEIRGEISALENQRQNPAAPPSAVPPTAAMATAVAPKAKGSADGNKGDSESMLSLYGYVMLDAGQNFKQIDPNWFDVMRPTQLSAFKNEFAPNGTTFWGVRQTRFGVKTSNATTLGDLKTVFEFELFGTGVDAGQTTFRLRHAYGELGHFGAGQTWSPFMDFDVFPNSLEYWGPNGMVFLRNLQVRWMPIKGDSHLTIAAERPGASADLGIYANRIELQGIQPKLDMPDFSIQGRFARRWGYVQVASVFRKISWVDLQKTSTRDLSGEVFGWGVNASSNLKLGKKSTGRFQVVYGEGVENYLNDAPVDVGVRNNFSNSKTPIKGVALPALGVVAFLDHNWSEKFSTAAGYSLVNISNSDAQAPSAFHQGDYALTNLLYNPVKNVMVGGEFQFGRRVNFNDGFNTNDYKLQFSFKYSWAKEFAY